MKEIPIKAKVTCADGAAGKMVAVIVNPYHDEVTHIVVKDPGDIERLVPWKNVSEATDKEVILNCSLSELKRMTEFVERQYVENQEFADYAAWESSAYSSPYVTPVEDYMLPLEIERIPPGELAFHRGSFVEASDGHIGTVQEFIIKPEDGHITHLILQKGHLWGKRLISIPMSAVDHFIGDTVYLKLDKHAVGELPSIPIKRR